MMNSVKRAFIDNMQNVSTKATLPRKHRLISVIKFGRWSIFSVPRFRGASDFENFSQAEFLPTTRI